MGLSPGGSNLSNPGTPGSNLWNSLLNATTSNNQNTKTGLTPNESNLRSELTPGGNLSGFGFGHSLSNPSLLINSPMTPGLTNFLGSLQNNNSDDLRHIAAQQQLNPQQQLQLQRQSQQQSQQQQQHDQQQQQQHQQQQQQQHHQQQQPQQHQQQQQQPQLQQISQPAQPQSQILKPTMQPIKEASNESLSLKREAADENSQDSKRQKSDKKPKVTKTRGKKNFSGNEDEDDEPMHNTSRRASTDDEKRKNFLERNRVAASKCRQRKKQLNKKMEEELSFYSNGYRELSAQINQLRESIITLKGLAINHKDCPNFINLCGGYESYNSIIEQANFVTQLTTNTEQSVTSMPSTIPTTLNENIDSNGYRPPDAPTQSVPPGLPLPMDMNYENTEA